MTNSCSAAPETNKNKVEELRDQWDALSREEKRKRALELINEDGYSKRGLAKALNISESTLRYCLNVKQVTSANSASAAVPASGNPGGAAGASLPERSTTPARCANPLINFLLNEVDLHGMEKRAAARQETARLNDLVLAFAAFLGQNWSVEPQNCLNLVRLIETRLKEAELSRHLPQPLPAGTDPRRVLARIPPEPHTEDFEQVVHRAVVGLLYLADSPEMRHHILRGLAQLFRSEIQHLERIGRTLQS